MCVCMCMCVFVCDPSSLKLLRRYYRSQKEASTGKLKRLTAETLFSVIDNSDVNFEVDDSKASLESTSMVPQSSDIAHWVARSMSSSPSRPVRGQPKHKQYLRSERKKTISQMMLSRL